MHPVITIFCAFTRRWNLEGWLAELEKVKHDPTLTNLCFIVDMDDTYMVEVFKAFAAKHYYRSFHYKINEGWYPNEVRLSVRRARIAEVKNQSKALIGECDGDIVICFEDDTVFGDLDIRRLTGPLVDDPKVGFVEGVQCGRWGVKMIGAWKVDDIALPKRVETILPGTLYESIDGGGFYGYATRKDLYMEHDYFSATSQPWGPDLNYGLYLRMRDYECLIDWSTIFGHNDYGKILYPIDNLERIIFTREDKNGRWNTEYAKGS